MKLNNDNKDQIRSKTEMSAQNSHAFSLQCLPSAVAAWHRRQRGNSSLINMSELAAAAAAIWAADWLMASSPWHELFNVHSNTSSGKDNNATRDYHRRIPPCHRRHCPLCWGARSNKGIRWRKGGRYISNKVIPSENPNGSCASNSPPADLLALLICRSFPFKWA